VGKLDGPKRKPGVMIVEEPQDTNAALEQRRMMGTQVSISPGCGEFIFGLDRRRLFRLRVDLEGQKKSSGAKITQDRKSLDRLWLIAYSVPPATVVQNVGMSY
jgi:hypothetical protein